MDLFFKYEVDYEKNDLFYNFFQLIFLQLGVIYDL